MIKQRSHYSLQAWSLALFILHWFGKKKDLVPITIKDSFTGNMTDIDREKFALEFLAAEQLVPKIRESLAIKYH